MTVAWSLAQVEARPDCVDKWDVGVRDLAGREERRLCSLPAQPGLQDFHCRLDLSHRKFCGSKFGFWVTAVNTDHNRGEERVQSFANTILEVVCDGQGEKEEPEKVFSSSCLAVRPGWTSRPFIQQTGEARLQ